jgi:hypothetical protein
MSKILFVSDFDDTLAQTDSKIYLTRNGKKIVMDPAQFAKYEEEPGDQFDFSEFDKLINPRPIQRFVKLLKHATGKADKVAVLTARGHTLPVVQFLRMHGIRTGVSIAALGDANPQKKAEYIKKHLEQGFDKVVFIDDSSKNVAAVKALRDEYPKAKIVVHHAKDHPEPTSSTTSDSGEPPKQSTEPQKDNSIAAQAKTMGLVYLGFGRYGKKIDGKKKVTHTVQNGRLIQKNP